MRGNIELIPYSPVNNLDRQPVAGRVNRKTKIFKKPKKKKKGGKKRVVGKILK
jgi:hypothetical protein